MTRFAHSFLLKIGAAGLVALTLFTITAPAAQAASSSIEYAGWIPYWATDRGTADADAHLSQLTEVNPFGYTVKNDGSLYDAMNLSSGSWQSLFRDAHNKGVKVVPTIMWSDTGGIYNILHDPIARAQQIKLIVQAVKQNHFDGVDIDYEGKSAETRESYSAFLSELSAALYASNKTAELDCTIEARMPLAARYSGTPPANIEYANDLPTINKVCDRVRLMTYDQGTADLQLNAAHSKDLYAPVSDAAWVQKVVNYMSTDIDKSKILIGVATYGAEYQAMSDVGGGGFTYTKTSSFNPQYGLDIAKQYGITPGRNASGEPYLSYVDKNQTSALPSNSDLSKLAPKGTDSGNLAAAGALAYSKKSKKQAPVTFLTWSDSQAIADKAELAKKLGVAGIAIFKLDGSEDPSMWGALASVAGATMNPSISRSTGNVSATPTSISTATTTETVSTPNTTPSTTTPIPPTPTIPTTPPAALSFTKDLQFGDENADVKRLQTILIQKGYMKVAANGYFGPATKAALTTWQKAAKLPATGFFGPMSRAKISS